MAAEDCSVAKAWRVSGAFVRQQRRGVSAVFGVVLALVVAATGVSLLATAALGLIAFVPFVGLAVLPLQLLAWVFRGVVFQFLGPDVDRRVPAAVSRVPVGTGAITIVGAGVPHAVESS